MRYILSIDQGTTGTRATLFDEDFAALYSSYIEHTQHYPKSGWVEHDAEEIFRCVLDVCQLTIDKAEQNGIKIFDIAAVGIANQGETVVIWDAETGKTYHNAIVWQCKRSADYVDELKRIDGFCESVHKKTGLIIDAYFSATKIRWLLDNVPETKAAMERRSLMAGTLDSYLIFRMTVGKSFVTDVSTASRTMLFNITELCWDDEILETLKIPKEILPKVLPSSGNFGTTDKSFCGLCVPIAGSITDQQGALLGHRCYNKGDIKCTYGTGCFMLMNIGDKPLYSKTGLLTTVAWQIGDTVTYALDGGVYVAGSSFQWLRDKMHFIKKYDDIDRIAQSVNDNDGVYFVTAFSGLGAPHWDANARGMIIGITSHTEISHIVRGAVESIAFKVNDVLDCMKLDSNDEISKIYIDGGVSKSRFLMQFQSDITGQKIYVSKNCEMTSLGAAMLAALYMGWKQDVDELLDIENDYIVYSPKMDEAKRFSMISDWNKAVIRSKNWENRD